MKKLTRVIFIIALLAMVVLPLSARKAMNVSWEWLLSDPDVTAYRYQLNGEAEDGWTVVDGMTSAYTATGLDPYSDYTLYLQCSYDGINWSESASSTAYALLKLEEEAPAAEAVETAEVVEAEEKVEETVFYVYGIGISNRWTKSSFESTTLDDGILTSDEVLGFIQYEAAKYPSFVNSVYYSLVDNGFSLTFEEGSVDVAALLPQYRTDITEYVDSLLVSLAQTVEETVEEAVEAVLDSLVEETAEEPVFEETFGYRGLKADLKLYSTYGTVVLPAGTTASDIADAAALLVMKYPEASLVTYTFDDGVLTLSYPEISGEYASALYPVLKNEAEWYIDQILSSLASEAPEEVKAEAEAETKVVISEDAPLYADTLTYKGVTSTIEVDNTWATLTIPEGMTTGDIQAVASMLSASYKEAAYVTYSVDGDTVTLTYPEMSDDFLLGALDVLREEAMALIDRIDAAKAEKAPEAAAPVAAPAEEVKAAEEAPAEKSEETPSPAEAEKTAEAPAPVAPVAVEAVPVKETKKESPKAQAVKASFNMGLNGGLEWGMGKVLTEGFSKTPTIYPFVSFTLEGQNLVHFGAFGLGLRSDISAVFIPESRNMSSNPSNVWGFDATADLKLMTYINASFARFYFGAGIGYSAASDGFTSVHSTEQRILKGVGGGVGFNTAFAVTGVLGAQFNLGKTVTLSAEGYARWFFDNPGKLDTLTVAATVGLGVRF